MVTDPAGPSRIFCGPNLALSPRGFPHMRPPRRGWDAPLAEEDLQVPGANEIGQPADAREAQLTVKTQRGPIVPVARDVEPPPRREGPRRHVVHEGPPEALPARLGSDRQQRDEAPQE